MPVVVADIEACPGLSRDHICRSIAHIDGRDLQCRWLKMRRPLIERGGGKSPQHCHQTVHRIVGEMGVGKTITAIATAYLLKPRRVLVMCPPHLVRKWEREIMITYPEAGVFRLNNKGALKTISDLYRNRNNPVFVPDFYVIGRERAKLSEPWQNVIFYYKKMRSSGKCPNCFSHIDWDKFNSRKKYICSICKQPAYQFVKKYGRWSIADFIKRKLKGVFDLGIFDEVHELKGGDTAQGNAFGAIASAMPRVMNLTGTYNGGYPENIFYILYRTRPYPFIEERIGYREVDRFIDFYGARETKEKKAEDYEDHAVSRGRKTKRITKVLPVISPALIGRHIIDRAIFLRLSDIADSLPEYNEELINIKMDPELRKEYDQLASELRDIFNKKRSLGFYSVMAQALLQYPDSAYEERRIKWKEMENREIFECVRTTKQVFDENTYSYKEKELVRIIKDHRRQIGRAHV